MAFKEIREFPAIASLATSALMLVQQAGTTGQATLAQLIALVVSDKATVCRFASSTVGNSTSARFMNAAPSSGAASIGTSNSTKIIAGLTGKLKSFSFTLDAALATADLALTVQINDVDTAMVATLSHGTVKVTVTGSVTVLETDAVGVKIVASQADNTSSLPRASVRIEQQ